MQPERGIAHQRHVHQAGGIVDLISIESVRSVVLRQARAEPDGFAQAHVLTEPVRLSAQDASQPVCLCAERGAHEVVLGIPVAQPTAGEHVKHRVGVRGGQVPGSDFVIKSGIAEARDADIAGAAGAVGPKITLIDQRGQPLPHGHDCNVRRTEPGREVAPGARRVSFPIAHPARVVNQTAPGQSDEPVAIIVVFAQILP